MEKKQLSNIFYKPKIGLIILDVLIISLSVSLIFLFLPLTSQDPFRKYAIPVLVSLFIWLILSYFFKRYTKLRSRSFSSRSLICSMYQSLSLYYWAHISLFSRKAPTPKMFCLPSSSACLSSNT